MKRILVLFPLLILFCASIVSAQVSYPKGSMSGPTTVPRLPASGNSNILYDVRDANSSTDCTVGLGTTRVVCWWNGSAYVVIGGGGGAATSITVGTTTLTGGTDTRVAFDDGGVYQEDAGLVFNKTTDALTVAGTISGAELTVTGAGGISFIDGTEGIAATGIASHDILYADSAAHRWKTKDNNGSADTFAKFSDGLNVFAAGAIANGSTATTQSQADASTKLATTAYVDTGLAGKQATITFGTGVQTALGVNVGTAGAPVVNGGALGTPSSGTLTNASGLPVAGLSNLGSNVGTFLITPSSANLRGALSDENGSGVALFDSSTSATFITPILGTPASVTLTNATGLPVAGLSNLGSNVGTFLITPSGANLAAALTTALPVSKGGTNCTAATITCFNNITGFTAAGTTGTTSTNLVFSTSPTLTTPAVSGTLVQTSNSSTAFESGPNGSTNPVLRLVNSTASQADGISVTGGAAGNGTTITALSSGSNAGFTFTPKGTGAFTVGGNVLNSIDGTNSIGASGGNRFIISAFGIEVGTGGAPVTGEVRTSGVQLGLGATSTTYSTNTNCTDSAGAAACGTAAAGSVVIDAAATTVVVSTTRVTANSQIFVQFDSSLGARLGITCNTTVALPVVTARTAATSFTITVPVAPITNAACYSYFIVN